MHIMNLIHQLLNARQQPHQQPIAPQAHAAEGFYPQQMSNQPLQNAQDLYPDVVNLQNGPRPNPTAAGGGFTPQPFMGNFGLQPGADPFGWNNNANIVARFRNPY